MEKKFEKFIDSLELPELYSLKHCLVKSSEKLSGVVEEKIKHFESMHSETCSVCGNLLDAECLSNYTLVFGPASFRKKASFCALDCMQYFISKLKYLKEDMKKIKKDN